MKIRVLSVLMLALFAAAAYSCSDTSECVCTVNGQSVSVSDWDGDCADITSADVPDLGSLPCEEQ